MDPIAMQVFTAVISSVLSSALTTVGSYFVFYHLPNRRHGLAATLTEKRRLYIASAVQAAREMIPTQYYNGTVCACQTVFDSPQFISEFQTSRNLKHEFQTFASMLRNKLDNNCPTLPANDLAVSIYGYIYDNLLTSTHPALQNLAATFKMELVEILQSPPSDSWCQREDTLKQLCGLWVEKFDPYTDGQFALGAFYWDASFAMYRYEGTRFNCQGQPIYHWQSNVLQHDTKGQRIVYDYWHRYEVDGGSAREYGLGVLTYESKSGEDKASFTGGLFSDSASSDSCDVRLKMQRLDSFAKDQPYKAELSASQRVQLGPYCASLLAKEREPELKARKERAESFRLHLNNVLNEVKKAAKAAKNGQYIPIGAALFAPGNAEPIGRGVNRRMQDSDPSAHAEVVAFKNAGRRESYRDVILVTTLAPCWFCCGLIKQFGIKTVVVGDSHNFSGGIQWLRSQQVEVIEMNCGECVEMFSQWKTTHPMLWSEDIGGCTGDAT